MNPTEPQSRPSDAALEAAWRIYKSAITADHVSVRTFARIIDAHIQPAPTGSHASAGAEAAEGIARDAVDTILRLYYQDKGHGEMMAVFMEAAAKLNAPATPAVAEPATEGDGFRSFIMSYFHDMGENPAREEVWEAACAYERQRAASQEIKRIHAAQIKEEIADERVKELEAKLAAKHICGPDSNCDAQCSDLAAASDEIARLEQCVMDLTARAKDSEHNYGCLLKDFNAWKEVHEADKEQAVARERMECAAVVPNLTTSADFLFSEGRTVLANELHALSQRLTQPANRSAEPTDSRNENPSAEEIK
jgi:hypothetical protein